ncbi:SPFH domain-containing protein [Intestinicryptomonas porci]|uniref:SPFH domain-containing protein n=1 Tax=Intestinicryptomonas porci TaxID=2926320 RepID=A0ABU4WGR4_9BACT|nr:SPFH domain-containing protein [Opitutales bacterium CLA-KB-P66]
MTALIIIPIILIIALAWWIVTLRRVVPTNMVHILQYSRKTISYGKGQAGGNVYYEFPAWIPVFGITKRELPVSNFDLNLDAYEAYDQDRVPFVLDIKAFFRIADTNEAANKVGSFGELQDHLKGIVQGAVRSIMANAKLEDIMSERSVYGEKFTNAVSNQLHEWGVVPVKNIELMDIRDAKGEEVISNIMAKKKSDIEKESRIEVAKNRQIAKTAEIEAQRIIEVKAQDAAEAVGKRKAEVNQAVGIQDQIAQQEIASQAKLTKEKEMEVARVQEVKQAEIRRQAEIIKAEQEAKVITTIADANLSAKQKEASGIEAEGKAMAKAKELDQLASVTAQTELAAKIGENKPYQEYLIRIEQVRANQAVGIEQAKNLGKAQIKVIANAGDIDSGVNSVREVFSPKGGTAIGGMLEALANTDTGKALIKQFLDKSSSENPKASK